MHPSKKIIVIIADKIHNDGVVLLSKRFKVFAKFGLNNEKLFDFIFKNCSETSELGILIIRSNRKIDKDFIKKLRYETSVKSVCTVSSGFDNVDIASAKKYKIRVINVPNGNYISAAEHTFALLLAITKKLKEKHAEIRSKRFYTQPGQTTELFGKTIGIIGVGRVGSYTARLAKSFGMKVLGNDIKRSVVSKYKWIRFVPLNSLLRNSDYITIHTPLDNTTRYLINKSNLKLIKRKSFLLNCSRGGVVDENALYNALKNNRIYYAGLDVFENEPNINFRISKLKNVLLTPHIAGKTIESYRRMALMAAEIIINKF